VRCEPAKFIVAEKQTSWGLLEMYFRNTPIPIDEKPEAVEVPVEADLVKHGLPVLIGVIDLVRKAGRIVDFKTTGQTPNPDKANHLNEMQMSCYSVLYREAAGKTESGLELHHLVKLKTPKLVLTSMEPMTQAQETRLFRIMESYVNGLDRQDWIPSPSPMSCSCCEFFNECRRWS
jgi:putative RecB family exonuclease